MSSDVHPFTSVMALPSVEEIASIIRVSPPAILPEEVSDHSWMAVHDIVQARIEEATVPLSQMCENIREVLDWIFVQGRARYSSVSIYRDWLYAKAPSTKQSDRKNVPVKAVYGLPGVTKSEFRHALCKVLDYIASSPIQIPECGEFELRPYALLLAAQGMTSKQAREQLRAGYLDDGSASSEIALMESDAIAAVASQGYRRGPLVILIDELQHMLAQSGAYKPESLLLDAKRAQVPVLFFGNYDLIHKLNDSATYNVTRLRSHGRIHVLPLDQFCPDRIACFAEWIRLAPYGTAVDANAAAGVTYKATVGVTRADAAVSALAISFSAVERRPLLREDFERALQHHVFDPPARKLALIDSLSRDAFARRHLDLLPPCEEDIAELMPRLLNISDVASKRALEATVDDEKGVTHKKRRAYQQAARAKGQSKRTTGGLSPAAVSKRGVADASQSIFGSFSRASGSIGQSSGISNDSKPPSQSP